MSNGAGEVVAVGPDVIEFAVGDHIVSTFFPTWLQGAPVVDSFATVPGDGVDGYRRAIVTRPATAFTRAPQGHRHAEAATLTTAFQIERQAIELQVV
jgi:NADPH:quinone reductase-like Zn-dependent oxidoreductase